MTDAAVHARSGAFSCVFANHPTRAEVEAHLAANGFRVLSAEQHDNVLQVYFYSSQLGAADAVFLCEFVLLFARRFFQATFKCKVRIAEAGNFAMVVALWRWLNLRRPPRRSGRSSRS